MKRGLIYRQRFSLSISPKLSPLLLPPFSPECPPKFLSLCVFHFFLALYCKYSFLISGQSLDSTDSREFLSAVKYVGYGIWAHAVSEEHGGHPALLSRPGWEARQRRRVNINRGSLSQLVDWSLSEALFTTFFYHSIFFFLSLTQSVLVTVLSILTAVEK